MSGRQRRGCDYYSVVPGGSYRTVQHIPTPWLLCSIFVMSLLTACASTYRGSDLGSASFLQRAQTQVEGDLTVRAAVPDAAETLALTGLDLYAQGIQPVWLEVENSGDHLARLSMWSIDPEYFSPIEVAYINRKQFSDQG